MTLALRFLAASAFVLTATSSAAAQGVTVASDMLKDWQQQKATMVAISDAMPEDKFGFKSTPPQRSPASRCCTSSRSTRCLLGTLGAKAAAPAIDMKATSKAGIVHALRQSYDYGEAVFKEFNDAAWTRR